MSGASCAVAASWTLLPLRGTGCDGGALPCCVPEAALLGLRSHEKMWCPPDPAAGWALAVSGGTLPALAAAATAASPACCGCCSESCSSTCFCAACSSAACGRRHEQPSFACGAGMCRGPQPEWMAEMASMAAPRPLHTCAREQPFPDQHAQTCKRKLQYLLLLLLRCRRQGGQMLLQPGRQRLQPPQGGTLPFQRLLCAPA